MTDGRWKIARGIVEIDLKPVILPRARIVLMIYQKLERRFRKVVGGIYGHKTGALQIAGESAIREWVKKYEGQQEARRGGSSRKKRR
jgi:hypothetical protein